MNNNPVRYTDPTGHQAERDGSQQSGSSDPCVRYGYGTPQCPSIQPTTSNGTGGGEGCEEEDGFSFLAWMATGMDTAAALLNIAYFIPYAVIGLLCAPCIAPMLGVYQIYSAIPNSVSTVAMVLWAAEGIRTGQTSISWNFESSNTGDFSTTNIVSGSTISLSIDQDTAVAVATNAAGWTILREPGSATIVDLAVAAYDYTRNAGVFPAVNPTFSYSTNSAWSFSWFR